MTTALAVVESTQLSAAHSDDMLISLFVGTKRSDKTKTQYSHSVRMLVGFTGKPLQVLTLQDANVHAWLKERYSISGKAKGKRNAL